MIINKSLRLKLKDNIEWNKVKLVVKCCTQKKNIDYNEIFSLVFKNNLLKIIMVLVTHYNLNKWKFRWINLHGKKVKEKRIFGLQT